ncbi:MAG: GNAT family N-acetyltransferase [Bryobacterales bacterium]|nr:GNAT family N-acetyltransferase [Bryobacterales bacterium]
METQNRMIRQMLNDDIPGAMLLKHAAGWNQTPGDWQRLLRLEPEGCFVAERDGLVVGSTTVVRYGSEMAWLGMVLVLPEYRRQGIARALVRHALDWLDRRGTNTCGLDATSMGIQLYEQVGFTSTGPIERWERPPEGNLISDAQTSDRCVGTLSAALERIDRDACNYDRSRLLRDLCEDSTVTGVIRPEGFSFGRPGSSAWFVGPCVAKNAQVAGTVLRGLLEDRRGQRVFWDFLPSNQAARELAAELGFRPVRRLERMMLRGGQSLSLHSHSEQVYATAGFEFG